MPDIVLAICQDFTGQVWAMEIEKAWDIEDGKKVICIRYVIRKRYVGNIYIVIYILSTSFPSITIYTY